MLGGGGGGGMYNFNCSPTIDRCTFVRNLGGMGGGMLNYYAQPTITNCIFNTNSNNYSNGRGGAIANMPAHATIINCTFYQNGWQLMPVGSPEPRFRPWTHSGGAVYDQLAGSTIFNCIFSNNAAKGYAGAVDSVSTRNLTKLTNCLFYDNISWQGWNNPSYVAIDHVQGNFDPDSINNFYDIDPLQVDPAGGDFHLRYDSPCIDAGYALTFGYLPYPYPFGLPDTDFEGDKRIVDSDGDGARAIDIGADEFVPNVPDLRAFLQTLADRGELDLETAAILIACVNDAQEALDQEEERTARCILDELIADAWVLLGDTETAYLIEMKTLAVIEEI